MQFQGIGSESIGCNKIGTCLQVLQMDGQNILRMGDIPAFRQFSRFQTGILQKCSHSTIKKEHPTSCQLCKKVHPFHSYTFRKGQSVLAHAAQ